MKGLIRGSFEVENSGPGEDEEEDREEPISIWSVPLRPPVVYSGATPLGGATLTASGLTLL